MKKFLVGAVVTLYSVFSVVLLAPIPVNANTCQTTTDSNFLSFPTWYRGLCQKDTNVIKIDKQTPADVVFTVALNIIDIVLRIVAIITVGFIIYGGFRYITSRGSPEDTKKARDTILHAIIGMVIAMVAATAVGFIVGRLNA